LSRLAALAGRGLSGPARLASGWLLVRAGRNGSRASAAPVQPFGALRAAATIVFPPLNTDRRPRASAARCL